MEYGLARARAHGTAAIRTHLNSRHSTDRKAWRVFRALRDEWAGRIALQAVSLCPPEGYDGEEGRALADLVLFGARHPHELLARPQSDRIVLRRGRVLDARLPDPAVLDGVAIPATPAASGARRAG